MSLLMKMGLFLLKTEISIKKSSPNKTESSLMSHFDLKPTFKTVLTKKFYINLKLSQFTSQHEKLYFSTPGISWKAQKD